ncbi:MAG: terminase large subunit [Gammaproteobacteria bacterium]|nr:terminase large subunit [Gammaproteobacteria bacterium]
MNHFKDYPHSRGALSYAYDVVTGHRLACKQERQACQRFIDDLQHLDGYVFDVDKAEKACRFIEQLPHTKGKWAARKQNLVLNGWQKFIICNLFGWVDELGLRRFRKAYLKIPRKNGKSIKGAGIGHYMLAKDGEFGAEVYSGATTEKQAWEVFGPARLMAMRTPDLTEHFGMSVNAKSLTILENGSKFEPMIGKPGDGSSPSCAIIDEYHEHDTDDMVETMETGMGAREQPLLLMITTAGSNISGPCYDMESECKKLLDGVFADERIFTLMYGIDEGDDWTAPAILEKANPNIDVSVSREFLEAQQREAIRNASKQNAFKRKHLNEWVGAHTAWMNMESFNNCADVTLKAEDFNGKDCIVPVDLASRIDITAILKVFIEEIKGKTHYTAFCRFYIPEETAFETRNSHYRKWINEGWLTATDGNEIDFNEIQSDIKNDLNEYNAKEITYDPWRATQLAQGLQAEGANIIEFRNTVANMSPAMYELEAAITSGRFHYDGNPVLTWMMSNVVAKTDAKDNIYPRKQKPENKIDGVVALIMAIGRAIAYDETDPNPYESRGLRTL